MIIALDVEGVLISNAVSQVPRSGLAAFLWGCRELGTVVVYTSVPEDLFRRIAADLARRGEAPDWFGTVAYVRWSGPRMLLSLVPGADHERTILVDDSPEMVHPAYRADWIHVPSFEPPYGTDRVIESVLADLRTKARPSRAVRAIAPVLSPWDQVAGPFLLVDGMQARLGVTRQAVSARARRRGILRVISGDGVDLYPAWQFVGNPVLPGLPEVLRLFPGSVDGWTVAGWLRTIDPDLSGTPLDALRRGDVARVRSIARTAARALGG